MSRYRKGQKILRRDALELPANLAPIGTKCIQLEIPDDLQWEENFFSILTLLTKWNSYQEDNGRSAKLVAAVWRDVIWSALSACDVPTTVKGIVQEDFMPLRVDCDCNVWVTCCDGTEKQILTSEQVKKMIQGQPGDNSPQPPAGGCQPYHFTLHAQGVSLVPTPVSTGDTIEVTNADGASYDAHTASWRCPNGYLFFGGACINLTDIDGANPVPASPAGQLIVNLGGTFYPLTIGTPFVVPGGVSNVQPVIQLNYATLSASGGDLQIDVAICNNQAAPWVESWNFILVPGPFAPWVGNRATWVPGTGWVPNAFPETQLTSDLPGAFPAGVFFDEIDFTTSPADTAEIALFVGGSYFFDDSGVTSPHAYAHPVTAGEVLFFGATTAGTIVTSMTIKGHGVNPF